MAPLCSTRVAAKSGSICIAVVDVMWCGCVPDASVNDSVII